MNTLMTHALESPVGPLFLAIDPRGALAQLTFLAPRALTLEDAEDALRQRGHQVIRDPDAAAEPARQLAQYFAGQRRTFELPLAPQGTEFQRQAWRALEQIPYGQTRTYAEQARAIGRPHAVRAIGRANGANPISIVVPCHRVIGKGGSLTGYGGGLMAKRTLLELEGVRLPDTVHTDPASQLSLL